MVLGAKGGDKQEVEVVFLSDFWKIHNNPGEKKAHNTRCYPGPSGWGAF